MVACSCIVCGKTFKRGGTKPGKYCSLACKAAYQRTQKPVDEAWLRQKYLIEGLGSYQIAKMVGRNPKQVYWWLKGYGIPIRERVWSVEEDRPYHHEEWLRAEYIDKGRTAAEIAADFGVTEANILFYMRRLGIVARKMTDIRAAKYWGLSGEANGMHGVTGANHPGWKGGCTPERQSFYNTTVWMNASRLVWQRDQRRCRRCSLAYTHGASFAIHHIVSFTVTELRAEPTNLVLLCQDCHYWVHGRDNTKGEFIKTLTEGGVQWAEK